VDALVGGDFQNSAVLTGGSVLVTCDVLWDDAPGRVGQAVASFLRECRGKSGLRRARCQV